MPFDVSKHPNPIITFVETKDFKPVSSEQVKKESGIDMLGLSQDQGKLQSIEIADGPTLELAVGDMASIPEGATVTWQLTLPFKEIWFFARAYEMDAE